MNWNEFANRSLRNIFDKLEEVYGQLELERSGISRADFWAFSGIVAVEQASSEARYYKYRTICRTITYIPYKNLSKKAKLLIGKDKGENETQAKEQQIIIKTENSIP
jgi:hypothetical protein